MKTIKTMLMLALFCPFLMNGQDDTTYIYNCDGCGSYTLVTTDVVPEATTVNINTESMPDTGTATLALFSTTASRKSKVNEKIKEGKNFFNVFPNPAKGNYYLYFESQEKCEGDLKLQDMMGRIIYSEKVKLKKGMNVIEKATMNYAGTNYFFTAIFNNKVFKQKVLFVK